MTLLWFSVEYCRCSVDIRTYSAARRVLVACWGARSDEGGCTHSIGFNYLMHAHGLHGKPRSITKSAVSLLALRYSNFGFSSRLCEIKWVIYSTGYFIRVNRSLDFSFPLVVKI
jgi:hypothetical protein